MTSYAKVAYEVFDGLGEFRLIGVDMKLLSLVGGAILVVGIIAVLPPLLLGLRHSLIQGMSEK